MSSHTDSINEQDNPEKAYRDELDNKGSTFTDSPAESEARDAAKIQKAADGVTQKMDGGNPYLDEDPNSDAEIRRETLEKK